MAATDGSPLTAHGLPLSDANSGPSAVSRKPIADSDRGIEHYAFLQSLRNGERVYPRLVKHFRDADDKYNSGLFYFTQKTARRDMTEMSAISDRVPSREQDRAEPPDLLTLDLSIDDKPLKEIIGSLYYPDCPYEFSVLPADILGQVYEQFLGKVIRLTAGHQAKVEEKPEVRKAGGVYYTPRSRMAARRLTTSPFRRNIHAHEQASGAARQPSGYPCSGTSPSGRSFM